MKLLRITLYVCCMLCFVGNSFGQSGLDSLTSKTYDELRIEAYKYYDSLPLAKPYLDALLVKARQEENHEKLIWSYHIHAYMVKDFTKKIKYYDTAIVVAEKNKVLTTVYPALLHVERGGLYFTEKNFKKALDDYIKAIDYSKINNKPLFFAIKFNIGILKRRLQEYDEAEKVFKEYAEYYKDNDDEEYLSGLFHLSNIYYESEQFEKANLVNTEGIIKSLQLKDSSDYYHFVVNEGINLAVKGRYKQALDSMSKAMPYITDEGDQIVCYFYLGKSYYNTNNVEKGLIYLKKVDEAFKETNDLLPKLSEAYDILINHYKREENLKEQLYYTNRLLKLDSIYDSNYKYLSKNLFKKYHVPELLEDKEALIEELEGNTKKLNIWIIILLIFTVVVLGVLYYYYRLKQQYQQRFDALIQKQKEEKTAEVPSTNNEVKKETPKATKSKPKIELDEEAIQVILENLKQFEAENKFLINQISLNEVAKSVGTNSKYLSKIINGYKDKNFSTYINDLRIDYLIARLQEDTIFRKYTIKAIAEEGGFTNSEAFSRAFFKKTGLKPSYFMRKLKDSISSG